MAKTNWITDKDTRAIVARAEAAGWSVRSGKSNHLKFFDPDGRFVTTSSSTPSDWRTQRNLRARLRREGLDLEHPRRRRRAARDEAQSEERYAVSEQQVEKEQVEQVEEPRRPGPWPIGEGPVAKVRAFLREHPGESFRASAVMEATGLELQQTRSALLETVRAPGFVRLERGLYAYDPDHDSGPVGPVARVRAFLRDHPGESFQGPAVAEALGLELQQTRSALAETVRAPGFVRIERGLYTFDPDRASQPLKPTSNGTSHKLRPRTTSERREDAQRFAEMEAERTAAAPFVTDRLATIEAQARANGHAELPKLLEVVTTDREGRLVLRDEDGDIWLAVPMRAQL